MRILLTGGAGFVGSHLTEWMLRAGHQVTVLDRLDCAGRLEFLVPVSVLQNFRFVWHDLKAPLPESMERDEYDWIVHLAAASHVDRSIRYPAEFIADNVMGTVNLLEYARRQRDLKRFLYFSSDEVFGPADRGEHFDDHARHWANNPYAASKSAAEQLCPAWANTYDLPIVVSHCTNVYGPRQHHEKFIPLVREQVLRGETIQVHARDGVPSSRYYIHVYDVCSAVERILEKGGIIGSPTTGKYNIEADVERSNLDVAVDIAGHLGKPLSYELVEFAANRPKHDQRYAVDASRLRALGWKPMATWEDGLAETLDWYADKARSAG